jgi:hypothetical protein
MEVKLSPAQLIRSTRSRLLPEGLGMFLVIGAHVPMRVA